MKGRQLGVRESIPSRCGADCVPELAGCFLPYSAFIDLFDRMVTVWLMQPTMQAQII